jgi:hypothetical protein
MMMMVIFIMWKNTFHECLQNRNWRKKLAEKRKQKQSLGREWQRWENNIKVDFTEAEYEDMDRMPAAQNKIR